LKRYGQWLSYRFKSLQLSAFSGQLSQELMAESCAIFNSLIVGISVVAMSFIKGKVTHRVGGGWAMLLLDRRA
jgi:hypothetical protein